MQEREKDIERNNKIGKSKLIFSKSLSRILFTNECMCPIKRRKDQNKKKKIKKIFKNKHTHCTDFLIEFFFVLVFSVCDGGNCGWRFKLSYLF